MQLSTSSLDPETERRYAPCHEMMATKVEFVANGAGQTKAGPMAAALRATRKSPSASDNHRVEENPSNFPSLASLGVSIHVPTSRLNRATTSSLIATTMAIKDDSFYSDFE